MESANRPMRSQVDFFLISKSFEADLTFCGLRCCILPCQGEEGFLRSSYFWHQSLTHAMLRDAEDLCSEIWCAQSTVSQANEAPLASY